MKMKRSGDERAVRTERDAAAMQVASREPRVLDARLDASAVKRKKKAVAFRASGKEVVILFYLRVSRSRADDARMHLHLHPHPLGSRGDQPANGQERVCFLCRLRRPRRRATR
jgi:hypothetical protein